jgi:hypothetical protein
MAGNPEQLWFQKFEYEMVQKLETPTRSGKSVQTTPKPLNQDEVAA